MGARPGEPVHPQNEREASPSLIYLNGKSFLQRNEEDPERSGEIWIELLSS